MYRPLTLEQEHYNERISAAMSGIRNWVLSDDGTTPERCDDFFARMWWSRTAQTSVADQTWTAPDGTEIRVSTVFIGIEHILWETMIFGGPDSLYQRRHFTRDEAIDGHQEAVLRVTNWLERQS